MFRNLLEIEMQLRSEMSSLKKLKYPVLNSVTMKSIYDTIGEMESLTKLKAFQIRSPEAVEHIGNPSLKNYYRRINNEIIDITSLAKAQIVRNYPFHRREESRRIALLTLGLNF